jgi:effector-binding domain-containing protein
MARARIRTDGHNVFLYHHPSDRQAGMDVDFGVEVTSAFVPEGEIIRTETPAGTVATAVHRGPYDLLRGTHDAIHARSARKSPSFAGLSWEIYGDWSDDPAKLETTVCYLLG